MQNSTKKYDHKKYRDKRRNRLNAEGLCIQCGKEKQKATSKIGEICTQQAVDRRKRMHAERVSKGFCGQCLTRERTPGMRLCRYCRERKRRSPEQALQRRCLTYGITVEDYNRLLLEQKGVCVVCGTEPCGRWDQLDIDHCHKNGHVRGLLCHSCNKGLGCLKDDPQIVASALSYLENDYERNT